MNAKSCLSFLLLAACTEYYLDPEKKDPDPVLDTSDTEQVEDSDDSVPDDGLCPTDLIPAEYVGMNDTCVEPPVGGFVPVVEWEAGAGYGCLSLPVVADLDGDGMPEVIVNLTGYFGSPGILSVWAGDGSGLVWQDRTAALDFASSFAVADVDGDGGPEIVAVRQYRDILASYPGEYSALLYDEDGTLLRESAHYSGEDFGWGTQPIISDMDHDGAPEIVLGRVILRADLTQRGAGVHGRGSYGFIEGALPAVADLDGDGVEELLVGNAAYSPDGATIRHDPAQSDAFMAVVDLDLDGVGETIAISNNTFRAQRADGSLLWGPFEIRTGNILSPPAIADLDDDGFPEIVVAGGNELRCVNHDGSTLWTARVTDKSGATGASIFDFEGDGVPEVVYVDEVEIVTFNGPDGARKFFSRDHSSNTEFDYPVIADTDADGHAEIVVCHNFYSASAFSVYGDETASWMPARALWNQHAYTIGNIEDDFSVPVDATPSFLDTNTWHSAIATTGAGLGLDLEAEVLDLCEEECDEGRLWLSLRVRNVSQQLQEAGVKVAIYGVFAEETRLLALHVTADEILPGWTSAGVRVPLSTSLIDGAESLLLVVDDDGRGGGAIVECSETNNAAARVGPFCAG
jgi:hypothetical protein